MRFKKDILILVLIFAVRGEQSLSVGCGYTRLQQRFVLFEEDTFTANDEVRGYLDGMKNLKLRNHEIAGDAMFSMGTKTLWSRMKARWVWTRPSNLTLTTELGGDFRKPLDDEDVSGYSKWTTHFRARKKWAETIGSVRFWLESKDYSKKSNYSFDYTMSRTRLDFSLPLFGGDELALGYQFAFRYAPDTLEANCLRNNFYSLWQMFRGANLYRIDFEAERRVYNRGSLTGNHWRAFVNANPRFSAGERLSILPELKAEGYRYDWASVYNPNREIISFATGLEWAFTNIISAGIAPKILLSHTGEEAYSDKFYEGSIIFSLNILKYRSVWLDVEIEPGKRAFSDEPPEELSLYSDYSFVDANAFFIWWVAPRLRFDMFFSYSPEWHVISEDDITTLYFSTNIKYEFFR